MYCKYYGFSEKPFDVTPAPKFLYMTPGHREALASVMYNIQERRGFIAMVGDPGTGKTTLLRAAMERLDKTAKFAFIFHSDMPFDQVMLDVLDELSILKPGESLPKRLAIKRLVNFSIWLYARGRNLAIIVDEAQNFSMQTLENFRLISNVESSQHKLIQFVLAGQPELDQKLEDHRLKPFVQRINLKRYIKPLSRKETWAYLEHRLKVAQYRGPALFDKKTRKLIWKYSEGVPRIINTLCDNALLQGYAMDKRIISRNEFEYANKELIFNNGTKNKKMGITGFYRKSGTV